MKKTITIIALFAVLMLSIISVSAMPIQQNNLVFGAKSTTTKEPINIDKMDFSKGGVSLMMGTYSEKNYSKKITMVLGETPEQFRANSRVQVLDYVFKNSIDLSDKHYLIDSNQFDEKNRSVYKLMQKVDYVKKVPVKTKVKQSLIDGILSYFQQYEHYYVNENGTKIEIRECDIEAGNTWIPVDLTKPMEDQIHYKPIDKTDPKSLCP